MNYAYIRVSTDSQTVENQRLAIRNYAEKKGIENIKWFSETISGTKNPEKRKLGDILNVAKEGDLIIVTELSRLGRSLIMVLNVIQLLMDKKVSLVSLKEGYELGDNIQSKVIAFAFGLASEIERTLISERTKAGLERARQNGKRIGRQVGEKPHYFKLTPYRDKIKKYISEGRSLNSMAKEFGVMWGTMKAFCTVNIYIEPLPPLTERPKKHGHLSRRELEYFDKIEKMG